MNWFRVIVKLRSPTGTPWQADTIFGHLCWVVAHRDGEEALRRFLQPFLDGSPSFLLSDGFPPGLLPRPLSLSLPREDDLRYFQAARRLRKQTFLREDDFARAIRGESFLPENFGEELSTRVVVRAVLKNQISRRTGTTQDEGSLFGFVEHWMPEVVIYGKVQESHEEYLRGLFKELARSGYGKRKAVGYGAIDKLEFTGFKGFAVPAGADGFVTLSAFAPATKDPTDGRWRLRVKYGRLGEEFAFGPNPFKRPVVMLEPGSVFHDDSVKEFYGGMVRDVSRTHPSVVQYGYALAVAMKLAERQWER